MTERNTILHKINGLINDGSDFCSKSRPDMGLASYLEAKELAEGLGDISLIISLFRHIAGCHYELGNLQKALDTYIILLKKCKKDGSSADLADAYNYLGTVYRDLARYEECLESYIKAHTIYEKDGDEDGIIGTSLNIGQLQKKLGRVKLAGEYYRKAYKLCQEKGSGHQKALAAAGLASILRIEENYDESIRVFNIALSKYREIENRRGESTCLNNMGLTYEKMKDYENAFLYYEKGYNLSTQNMEKLKQAIGLSNMGNIRALQQKYTEAEKFLSEGLKLASDIDAREIIIEIYGMHYNLYKKCAKYEKALYYNELYLEEKDSVYNKNMQQKLSELMIKYETEAKEKEAEIYRLKNIDLKEKNKLIESQKKELQELNEKLKIKNEILFNAAIMDKLTGVYNRAYTIELFEKELERSKRYGWETGVILLDIDWFKKINDNYGHLTGDFVLREVAQAILETVRKSDIFGRFGGEEFLIILPNTALRQTETAGEKIRKIIESKCFKKDDEKINITVSLGVAGSPQSGNCLMDELIQLADDALYEAKGKGRNCLCISEAIKENKTSAK